MKRRSFFKAIGGATSTAALMTLPMISHANTQDGAQVQFMTDIGNNHGHDLELSIVQVIELMGQTQDGSSVDLDIQGQSGHPHAISLNLELLVDLLVSRELMLESTNVAGHTHTVNVQMSIQ